MGESVLALDSSLCRAKSTTIQRPPKLDPDMPKMFPTIEILPTAFFLKKLTKGCFQLLRAMGPGWRKYLSLYTQNILANNHSVPEKQENQLTLIGTVHLTRTLASHVLRANDTTA